MNGVSLLKIKLEEPMSAENGEFMLSFDRKEQQFNFEDGSSMDL
jgi:hypothetical protein